MFYYKNVGTLGILQPASTKDQIWNLVSIIGWDKPIVEIKHEKKVKKHDGCVSGLIRGTKLGITDSYLDPRLMASNHSSQMLVGYFWM